MDVLGLRRHSKRTSPESPRPRISMFRYSRKQLRLALMLLGLLLALSAQSGDRIVYRGKTGTKYHLQSCRTLRGKGIPIKLSEAKRDGREACKICKPGT